MTTAPCSLSTSEYASNSSSTCLSEPHTIKENGISVSYIHLGKQHSLSQDYKTIELHIEVYSTITRP
jgi:hypothetical protein